MQLRDAADALTCAEAAYSRSPALFLDGVARELRPAMYGDAISECDEGTLLAAEDQPRVIHAQSVHEGPSASRLFFARVKRGSSQIEGSGDAPGLQDEVLVLVFSVSQVAPLLREVLAADTGVVEERRSLVSLLFRRNLQHDLRAPSLSAAAFRESAGVQDSPSSRARAEWARCADQLTESAKDLLFGVEGGLRSEWSQVGRILVTGHGGGSLLAFRAFLSLFSSEAMVPPQPGGQSSSGWLLGTHCSDLTQRCWGRSF